MKSAAQKGAAAKAAAKKADERPRRVRRHRKDRHRQGLGEELEDPQSNGVRVYPRKGDPEKKRKRNREDDDGNDPLSAKLTGRILKVAREQQEEVDAEVAQQVLQSALGSAAGAQLLSSGALTAALRRTADSSDDDEEDSDSPAGAAGARRAGQDTRLPVDSEDDDDADDAELRARTLSSLGASTRAGAATGIEAKVASLMFEAAEDEEVSPEDEAALAAFMAPNSATYKQVSLGDLILSKLKERQAQEGIDVMADEGEEAGVPEGLDEKVVAVYKGVGKLLSRFTVGKVPKAFKIIPNLKNWEEVLWLTEPDAWSPHAMYEATKMFVSNLNARLAQRFLALVLLPRVRREIQDNQKLHFALFMALKKATYKPGAFYKGILLPLCTSRTCTLREAVIITSVLKRTSIPVLHSAAALMRMADMEYCGTTSFFMRVLLDKKYALPYRVIDGLVDHFVRFADDERTMPVVWHQTLLCFVQRYKDEIRVEDRAALRKLCSVQHHYLVTPEVLRELDHGKGRSKTGVSGQTAFAPQAAFTLGTSFGSAGRAGTGRLTGPERLKAQSQVAVNGKSVSENVRSMPPVMMMEDD